MNDGLLSLERAGQERAVGLRETPDVRVFGVVAVIAHHEVAAVRNAVGRLQSLFGRNVRERRVERRAVDLDVVIFDLEFVVRLLRFVGFVERDAVAVDDAVVNAQRIAGRADEAFDEIVAATRIGGGKTTTSSCAGLEKRYSNSLTSRTSWICSVGIIEPDGMKNVRTTNVIRNSATSPATMNASRYSRMTVRAEGPAPSARGDRRRFDADRHADDGENADQREKFERGHRSLTSRPSFP